MPPPPPLLPASLCASQRLVLFYISQLLFPGKDKISLRQFTWVMRAQSGLDWVRLTKPGLDPNTNQIAITSRQNSHAAPQSKFSCILLFWPEFTAIRFFWIRSRFCQSDPIRSRLCQSGPIRSWFCLQYKAEALEAGNGKRQTANLNGELVINLAFDQSERVPHCRASQHE